MEDLQRLVKIVTRLKQRQYPLLELKSINENSSKENLFFRHIRKGIVSTDDDAAELLYGSKSEDDRYRMLKSRLKQKLLNHIFFLDFTDDNEKTPESLEQECIHLLHQGRVLMLTGELKIAKGLFFKAYTAATRYEFTHYKVQALEEMVKVYSENHQPHVFEDTVNELNEVRKLYNAEDEAKQRYYYIKMMLSKSVNSRRKNMDYAIESIDWFYKKWKQYKSFNLFEFYYKTKRNVMTLQGEHEKLLDFLNDILSGKVEGYEINEQRLDISNVQHAKVYALLKLNRINEGLEAASQYEEFVNESQNEWFDLKELQVLLAMKGERFDDALEYIGKVFENKRFITLDRDVENKWKLYNAYLHFAHSGNFHMRNFNFAKFVDFVPEYDKSLEGYNVALLILQFIYYVERGDMDEITLRRDELKKYMANHFKENFSYRTRTIYKLLNIVVENDLNYRKILSRSKYLINKLNEAEVLEDTYNEMEIISYEFLWEQMMNMIKLERASSWD